LKKLKKRLSLDVNNEYIKAKISKSEKELNVNLDPKIIMQQKENLARFLKSKIEKTYLGDICL